MRVLLTGANGFLGKRVAKDLLKDGHELLLLVRNAKKLDRFMQEITSDQQKANVRIIEGYITSENLGLDEDMIKELEGKIDAVFHMAALLSFDEKDEALTHEVNVTGTKHVLDFAVNIQCEKFLYVSTAYTIGNETKGAEALYSQAREFVNSYERTKCEAEHLVDSYSNQISVAILRPAIIIGDSVTGKAETSFGLYGILKSLKLLKRRMARKPELQTLPFRLVMDRDVASNIVPVDYVSSVLVAALKYCKNRDILNITNPEPPRQDVVLQLIREYMELPNLETIQHGSEHQLRDDELEFNKPLSVFANYLGRNIHFPCETTANILRQANKPILDMDEKMLQTIIKGYIGNK
ncbi:SDR family oxidoreductase [Bacillus sp. JJ722]|uniref:SDR family oxidoreductase n=1 Tax=Bacillus sp. JJ722 TaxID=3122973 RepID=UPI003000DF98